MVPPGPIARERGTAARSAMNDPTTSLRSRPPSFFERARLKRRAPLIAALRHALRIEPTTRLVDLGGGTGALTELVGQGARERVVVEPSSRKVAAGRTRRPTISFVRTGAEHLPFEDGRFDRALSTMAYHHFEDPDRALAEARRVLAPGGRVVICDLDPRTGPGRIARWCEQSLLRHAFHFETADALARRLHATGFAVTSTQQLGPTYLVTAERLGDNAIAEAP